MVHAAA
ncbi:Protein of unknown function [Bacillus cereus]|nr:Protein of unknown function [Bacillus cereus]